MDKNTPQDQLQLLHRAIASTENGITIADVRRPDSPLVFVNPAFLRMTGYAAEDVLGRNCRFLQRELREQPGVQTMREAIAEGMEATVMLSNFRKDGTPFINELTLSPVRDGAGALTHYIGVQYDVTQREAAAREIQQLNALLARQAGELRATNEELEAFSYSLSHDLRGPLAAISGFANLLARNAGADAEKSRHYLARITAGAKQMDRMIEAMLNLAKASSSTLNLERCDVTAMAQENLAALAVAQPQRRVLSRVEPGMHLTADRALLASVLGNLLSNAWKFTGKTDAAAIDVGCTGLPAGGHAIFVRDNGAGFDPAQSDRLFSTFERLHSDAEFEGTGIGLATVRRIIDRHGGRIWAQSAPGQGATFFFTMGEEAALAAAPAPRD